MFSWVDLFKPAPLTGHGGVGGSDITDAALMNHAMVTVSIRVFRLQFAI